MTTTIHLQPEKTMAEVIVLRPSDDLGPLETRRDYARPHCRCVAFVLDDHEKRVQCKHCKKVFEPFEALLHMGSSWTRVFQDLIAVKRDIDKLRSERDALKAEVVLLKAQKRRAAKP